MKLYTIGGETDCSRVVPLTDSETELPGVFAHKENAEKELAEINKRTRGGYVLIEFDSEDEPE